MVRRTESPEAVAAILVGYAAGDAFGDCTSAIQQGIDLQLVQPGVRECRVRRDRFTSSGAEITSWPFALRSGDWLAANGKRAIMV
jgi:hypothetical protein